MVTCNRRFCIGVFIFVIVSLVTVQPSSAQVAGATLTGTVGDPSGAAVPNAKVDIRNTATGVARDVVSDSAGVYSAPNLQPGPYDVTTSVPGFSTVKLSGIVLAVGATQVLNITLTVGQVTQTVEVAAEAPAVELESSSLTDEVNSTTMRELPLNGRDWTQLATLQPGIASVAQLQPTAASGYNRGNRGYGNELTISGGRPQQNNYRIDGISVNDYANSGPGSVIGGALGVDGIEEFSVVTSNYSAEYGRTSGGVVNAITRPGTNSYHGDAFEFLRNSALDARNFFDPVKIPAFIRDQFGGAFGGAIRKDKTFFFVDYEGIRQHLGETQTPQVPSQDARNGIIHNANGTTCTIGVASPGCSLTNSVGTVGVDPAVIPFLKAWPLPASLIAPGNSGFASVGVTQVVGENFGSARVDHHFSENDTLFGSFQTDQALLTNPDTLDTVRLGNATARRYIALEEDHIFASHLVNNFRLGYTRTNADNNYGVSAINPIAGDPSFGLIPGKFSPSVAPGSGITGFGGGLYTPITYHWWWNSFQYDDDLFLTRGKHSMKFGASVERDQDNVFGQGAAYASWSFSSLTNFLENRPNTFSELLATSGEGFIFGYRQTIAAGYFEDDVHLLPNLTMNLGLRYEMSTTPTEVHNDLGNLRAITNPGNNLGAPLFKNPTLRNFAPRIGFAWDPFHNGKTSVRGGFAVFDVLPLLFEYTIPEFSGAPFNVAATSTGAITPGDFPSGRQASTLLATPAALRATLVDFNPKRDYVMQENLSIQRQLTSSLTGMVAYVGSHGVHLPWAADSSNIVTPTLTSAGYLWPAPTGTGTPINPNHGRVDTRLWNNSSLFNALEAQITKRLGHGLQAQGSFTWSKSIDGGSGSIAGDPFATSVTSLFYFDPRLNRGLSDFNVDTSFSGNFTWAVPTPHLSGVASRLLGGWQFGSIITANSGTPFTPTWTPAGSGTLTHTDFPSRTCKNVVNPGSVQYLNASCFTVPMAPAGFAGPCQTGVDASGKVIPGSCLNLLGNVRRNSVPGPGLFELDFSTFKNHYIPRISEAFNIQFRAEFFNILNNVNFLAPASILFTTTGAPISGAGTVTAPTATTSRQIQLAVKVVW